LGNKIGCRRDDGENDEDSDQQKKGGFNHRGARGDEGDSS
jgi:hypothetical protein